MFTLEDIRNIALQIEKNGEETYRRAAAVCADRDIAGLLVAMADDERRHHQWLTTFPVERPLTEEDREAESMGKGLLQEMLQTTPFLPTADELAGAAGLLEVLRRSRDFEEDTIIFYRFLLALLDAPEAIARMEVIITEEGRHRQLLETMRQEYLDKISTGLSC